MPVTGQDAPHVRREASTTEPRVGQDLSPSLGHSPWVLDDLTRLAAVYAAIGAAFVVCWVALSTKIGFSTQMIWLVVSIGAVIVVGCGSGRWLLSGFRRVNQLEQRVADRVERLEAALSSSTSDTGPLAPTIEESAEFVSGKGMTRYHRADCQLVVGKAVRGAHPERHLARGLRPCEICHQ
jgi:hypothetical protein